MIQHSRGAFIVALTALVAAACSSMGTEADNSARRGIDRVGQTELIDLPMAPGEVVMADRPAPVDIHAPCLTPVIQGIGRYADVGFVTPRFFAVAPDQEHSAFDFMSMGSGHSRFTARFRVPKSEGEAFRFWGDRERGAERVLFCDVQGTLRSLADSGINRLAVWPIDSVAATIQLNGNRPMVLNLGPDWNKGGMIEASIDLSEDERALREQFLRSSLGTQVTFNVSSKWRRTRCAQTITLGGVPAIDAFGLKDGQRGAVSLEMLKFAVMKVVSRSTDVAIDGECGDQFIGLPAKPADKLTSVDCERLGTSLMCRFEGNFLQQAFVFTTFAKLGTNIAGVF